MMRGDRRAGLVERLPDGRAEAAGEHALLDGHEQVVLGRELGHQPGVDRLGEARVGDGHGDVLRARSRSAASSALPTPVP